MDVIKEIGSIGSSHAVSSLSQMINKTVVIEVPQINILKYEQVADEMGGPEAMTVGLVQNFDGDVKGMMMFLLDLDFAHVALSSMMGVNFHSFVEFDEIGYSAIKEIGNIMAASYLRAVAELTGLNISLSIPDVAIDMVGAIMNLPAIQFADISDRIIYIKDKFKSDNTELNCHILMIPDTDSLTKMMTSLGIDA